MKLHATINGRKRVLEIQPGDVLLDTLRDHDFISVRRGCDSTSCGVCTILVEGKPVPSCTYLSARAEGKTITTVEGVQDHAARLAGFFGGEGADQCGFCNPGIALSVYALSNEAPDADEDTIRHYLTGHLCRCTGYHSQVQAVKKYLEGLK